MTTVIRHRLAPPVNGCRWCGYLKGEHGQMWSRAHAWHAWTAPTGAQRKARLLAHIAARGEATAGTGCEVPQALRPERSAA